MEREDWMLEAEIALRKALSSKTSPGLVEAIIEDWREEMHKRLPQTAGEVHRE